MESTLTLAKDATLHAKQAFCKFLTANDSGETGGHQFGILISKSAREMLFTEEEIKNNHILKKDISVKWQDDFITESVFTWYESKNELRLTKFGRGFSLLGPEFTGALFILTKFSDREFGAFILNTEDTIQQFLDSFGLTPAETNSLIKIERIAAKRIEKNAIDTYISNLEVAFPSSTEMSEAARSIFAQVDPTRNSIHDNPDTILIDWIKEEYRLFKMLEQARYGGIIENGFSSVDDFITFSNKVLNRRKSRAGKSLENHLSALFDGYNINYTAQGVTEGNKRPDFIFPSVEAYHDMLFSINNICTLAAKTTCKDRWRQVLNEADRLRDRKKYLCTLQQGISSAQMDEMQAEQVVLVVPKPYISTYPRSRQDRIWPIGRFIRYVQELEQLC